MTDVRIVREFRVPPERLFDVVTRQSHVLCWWGHDGMILPDCLLDFSRIGPWHCEMVDRSGQHYRMEGQVTHVTAPLSVGFSWNWRLPEAMRAPESHVTFTIAATATGSRLTIDHRGVPDDERGTRHETGWTEGPMLRLARYLDEPRT